MGASSTAATEVARDYYNSDDADNFYYEIWGGEDIHIGLYREPGEPIALASTRTVATMASQLGMLGKVAELDQERLAARLDLELVEELVDEQMLLLPGGQSGVFVLAAGNEALRPRHGLAEEAGLGERRVEVRVRSYDGEYDWQASMHAYCCI